MKEKIYAFGEFTFSSLKGLRRRGIPIRLPRRRQALLSALLDAGGEPLDHETLSKSCARKPQTAHNAMVSVAQNVFWLRRQLGDDTGTIVQTVLKRGYRIGVPISVLGPDGVADVVTVSSEASSPPAEADRERDIQKAGDVASSPAVVRSASVDLVPPVGPVRPEALVMGSLTGQVRPADHVDRCIEVLTASIRQSPSASALATLGWLEGAVVGDVDVGLRHIQRALDEAPNLGTAQFYKAWLLLAAGHTLQALAELDSALSVNGRDPNLLFLKGWLLSGIGNHQDVNSLLYGALVLHPNNLLLRWLRSISFALQGEIKRAETFAAQTLLVFPKNPLMVAMMTWIAAVQRRRDEALKVLESCQRTAGGYMSATAVAAVYSALGDRASASTYLGFAKVDKDPWRALVWADPRFIYDPATRAMPTESNWMDAFLRPPSGSAASV